MYITARERLILKRLLSTRPENLTTKQLAEELDVSVRTIHRDLKGIEQLLQRYDLELVKKPGVGIQLSGAAGQTEALKRDLFRQSRREYTPEERRILILCTLLEAKEPVKLISLASELDVTMATVSHDLTKLESGLEKFDLSLIRKRGYGVEIVGSESAKRRAMSNLIAENIDEVQFLSLIRENIQNKTKKTSESLSGRLLGLVEKRKLILVEKVVEEISKQLPYSLADSAYIGLVVHLALAIERIMQGENIEMDPVHLNRLKNTPEYAFARQLIARLETVFRLSIPEAEVGYITMHLQGARLRHDQEYRIEEEDYPVLLWTKKLIRFVEKELNCRLSDQTSLVQGLISHLKPALYRIRRNMKITNPMLPKIMEDYRDLFAVVKKGVAAVFPDVSVPDEEIGYLVMHFGSALLNKQDQDLHALIICSSGIGTSKMLETRIRQEIPEIKNLTNRSVFEIDQEDPEAFDLIISTIQLPYFQGDYLVVSPILTRDEVEKIRACIREKRRKKRTGFKPSSGSSDPAPSPKLEQTVSNMQKIHQYSGGIATILRGFQCFVAEEASSVPEALEAACLRLREEGVIQRVAPVVEALLKREEKGGLGIPGTRLALYHTRSQQVVRPSFTVCFLKQPFVMKGMDQSDIRADTLLLLLAPEKVSGPVLEVLSYISSLFIENDEGIALFQSGDRHAISAYLAKRFERFFEEKLKEIRSV
jgi:mannitol operon transcriptional antiterminator